MKAVDRYYYKVYKQTEKITRKLFGCDVTSALALRYQIKSDIEKKISKKIDDITTEDIISNHISCDYAKYRTLLRLLETLESACVFKTFTIEEFENEC